MNSTDELRKSVKDPQRNDLFDLHLPDLFPDLFIKDEETKSLLPSGKVALQVQQLSFTDGRQPSMRIVLWESLEWGIYDYFSVWQRSRKKLPVGVSMLNSMGDTVKQFRFKKMFVTRISIPNLDYGDSGVTQIVVELNGNS